MAFDDVVAVVFMVFMIFMGEYGFYLLQNLPKLFCLAQLPYSLIRYLLHYYKSPSYLDHLFIKRRICLIPLYHQ